MRLAAVAVFFAASPAAAQSALVPEADADHSGVRVDVDVWGWSRDYTEMATLGSSVQRFPGGKQRGEGYLRIFEIGSHLKAKHDIHVHYITQADQPHDPVPLRDIRELMWLVEWEYQQLWPRRVAVRKPTAGYMSIETMWHLLVEPGDLCRPAVGFAIKHKGERRYQAHVPLELEVPCSLLKMTDVRTYWAKKDLGAVMIRFDYSSGAGEASWRYPLAVAWTLGKPVRSVVRAADPKDPAVRAAVKRLEQLGPVKVEKSGGGVGAPRIDHGDHLAILAAQLAKELDGARGSPMAEGADLVVDFDARPEEITPAPRHAAPAAPAGSRELERMDELDSALDANPNPLKRTTP